MSYTDADVSTLARWSADERRAREAIWRTVAYLREQGCPWSVIGEALGVTRQAAWERYRHVERSRGEE